MNKTNRFSQVLAVHTHNVCTTTRHIYRSAATLLALFFTFVGTWADNITAEQALQQAQTFLQNRLKEKGSATVPQLTLSTNVYGLYVFNVKGGGGFVVVSNDDRTTPILGFSDSGAIDPDKMPDNMRAWLQGYADEIAWLEKHAINLEIPEGMGAKSRKFGPFDNIAPLVSTIWNQRTPFNNLCPTYSGGTCVTGCAATAMAQVMKYHEWPQESTTTIPSYYCSNLGQTMPELPPVTFDWGNMKNSYNNYDYNDTQAQAVATLMKYCGWSLKMEYGPSSGATSDMIASALKSYFDYNQTTQIASRSYYTYSEWVNLMYFELQHNRPIVYSGQSSGGGHSFVCDGYMYDYNSGTDFFHINWGWGGTSDNYFVLSALDPDVQGVGGSTSDDGFHYGQDAVIGIQKSTDNGDMSTIQPNPIDLKLNSITLSSNPAAVGVPVTITLNVTNNSSEYTGDIGIARKLGEHSYVILAANNFLIPSRQAKDCILTFTPGEEGIYDLVLMLPHPQTGYYTEGTVETTLIVGSSTNTPPLNFAVTPGAKSATINWTGNGNSYNVRYRTAGQEPVVFFDDFENMLGKWTIYTEGEAGGNPGWVIVQPAQLGFNAISGERAATALSRNNGNLYNADNWLVTPQVTFGNTVNFHVHTHPSVPDSYEVLLSTTGNAIEDFTVTLQAMATAPTNNEWNEVTIDLSAYKGLQGYIAIHHVSQGRFYLMIDDFGIYQDEIEAGEWINTTAATTSIELTDLAPETTYDYQLQTVYAGSTSDWSKLASFTTLSLPLISLDNNDNSDLLDTYNDTDVNVKLTGRTLYKDGDWNTLCLPFALTAREIDASDLAGADIRTLSSASYTNKTMTMDFTTEGEVEEIEAGTPYMIRWTRANDYVDDNAHNVVEPVFKNVHIDNTMNNVEIDLTEAGATTQRSIAFKGTYEKISYTDATPSVLLFGANSTLYYPLAGSTLGAQRAYFELTGITAGTPNSNGVRTFVLNFGDDINGTTTSINEGLFGDERMKNEELFDLQGRRVSGQRSIKKGMYIQNGRVVVIK